MVLQSNHVLWLIVAAYIAFVFVKGVLKARKIGSTDDFLVAGRKVGAWSLFCTVGATVIGGGASVGAIGKTYEWGLLMVLISAGWYLQFIFSGLVVAPKFRALKLYTVAGYFGHRFGEGPRFVAFVLSLLFSVFIVAAQMAAFGSVLSAISPELSDSGTVLMLSILIGGVLVVIYSTAGGLLAVIHTDVYQFVVLVLGFLITAVYCATDITEVWSSLGDNVPETFFHIEGGKGWLFLATTFFAFLLGETFAPGYATRFFVGRSVRDTKLGIAGVGAFLALFFPVLLFIVALYARLHFPDIESQQALPMVIKQINHPLIGGLVIGALLMAVMSSADSALNSATAIFVKDLFEHQLRWKMDDDRMLRLARLCTVGLGVVAIVIAVAWRDIIDILLFTYHLWAPAIILPVCVGVLTKARSVSLDRSVLITMIVAIAATLVYRSTPFAERVDPAVVGVAVSVVVFLIAIAVLRPSGQSKRSQS